MILIKIPFKTDIQQLLVYGKKRSEKYYGKFEGDTNAGSFDFQALGGRFIGAYVIKNHIIEFSLTTKPYFITTHVIEHFLRRHII